MLSKDNLYYIAGIGFLAAAKVKHRLRGYRSPKPFGLNQAEACMAYDINTVGHWLSHLRRYTGESEPLSGKTALELGPGSDLGTGIALLAQGCARYEACDVHDLASSAPDSFYQGLIERLIEHYPEADATALARAVQDHQAGRPSLLQFSVRERFDLAQTLGEQTIDLVFSQAAFEHFDDIDDTIEQLSRVCRPGAVLVTEIDLQTHSRWIRDRDPNNIYRYSDAMYKAFWFRGAPNRVRPHQYREALQRHGWSDVRISPLTHTEEGNTRHRGLHPRFADPRNQMNHLTIMVCARLAQTRERIQSSF